MATPVISPATKQIDQMKTTPSILLAIALFTISAFADDGTFPKIGSYYRLTFPPPLGQDLSAYKVVAHGSAEWFLVERDELKGSPFPNSVEPVTMVPKHVIEREWLNFNQVLSASSLRYSSPRQ